MTRSCVVGLLILSAASAAIADTNASDLKTLISWMEGSFTSEAQAAADSGVPPTRRPT